MAQYAVLMFERETPGGVADIPPEVMKAHGELPARMAEQGGRIVAGMALEQSGTATAIRGDLVTDGPFIETKEALGGFIIVEVESEAMALEMARTWPGMVHDSDRVEVWPAGSSEAEANAQAERESGSAARSQAHNEAGTPEAAG
jgi:hypothetical protein